MPIEPSPALPVWRPEHITPQWLTSVLCPAGSPSAIEHLEVEPVGTGQMADSFRLYLHYSEPSSGPTSIVGKFTAADEQSRATGVTMRTSEVEVRFYQQVAPSLPIRTPGCLHADVDPTTARFVLLLEDVAPARQGDQVAGCSVEEAASALGEMAQLHAPRWGDPALKAVEWLNRADDQSVAVLEAIYPALYAGFLERYGAVLPEPVQAVGDAFFPRIGRYLRAEPSVRTVQHADFRVDNLLFGGPDGRVVVVDWQTVTLGPAAADLSYFLGGSIDVADRRACETDLLRQYHHQLMAAGVEGYTWDDLWLDYRRYAYSGLVMAVGAAMMVARTERGDAMFLAMARRAAAHAQDMDSHSLLDS